MTSPRIGRVFGRLTVLERAALSTAKDGNHLYLCQCACGNTKHVRWRSMRRGDTKSCGCLAAEHLQAMQQLKQGTAARKAASRAAYTQWLVGMQVDGVSKTRHPMWNMWRMMLRRCERPANHNYQYYGGRGIRVCTRWRESFAAFVEDMGPRPSGRHSVDRIDNDGDYEPGNCRWATQSEQLDNRPATVVYRATLAGRTARVAQWCRVLGVSPNPVKKLIRDGASPEYALLLAKARKEVWLAGGADYSGCAAAAERVLARQKNPVGRPT